MQKGIHKDKVDVKSRTKPQLRDCKDREKQASRIQ